MQAATGSLTHPFLCPEFAAAVGRARPDARVAVLTDGSGIAGFFPFQRRRLGVGVPIGAGVNNCQGLVHAPGAEWDTRDLLRACQLSVWQFDCLAQGQRPFARYAVSTAASSAIDLTGGFAGYQKMLRTRSPKFCKELARKTRRLEQEAGPLRCVVGSRDLAGLRTLMRWKSDQYRRTGWIDFFDRPWIVDLVDDVFGTHDDWFGGQLSLLYAGETLVAGTFDLRCGPVLAGWFAAYDPRFSKQSPGLIHHLRMTEQAAARGVQLIDMGKGPEPYKQTLKSHDLLVAEGMAARGSWLAAAHQGRIRAVCWAGPRIRQHPFLYRAADRLLRHYGRTT